MEAARQGERCLVQSDGDALVGYTWVARSPLVFVMDGVYLSLPDDTAYQYWSYTNPEYRGLGYQAARALELHRRLAAEGKRRLFLTVECTNFASLKGVRKSGFEKVGDLHMTRRGGKVRVSLKITEELWCELRRP